MKYDPYNRTGKVSQRTMNAFFAAFTSLLKEKNYDEITVNDICMKADYPRTTFYNYYGSMDNLLIWSFDRMVKNSTVFDQIKDKEEFTDSFFEFVKENKEFIAKVVELNEPESKLFVLVRSYLADRLGKKLDFLPRTDKLPEDLVALSYAGAIEALIRWSLAHKSAITRKKIKEYFNLLTAPLDPVQE